MGKKKRSGGTSVYGRRLNGAGVCRKKGFEDRAAAEEELRSYRQNPDKRKAEFERLPIGTFECEVCGLWHITGMLSKAAPAGRLRRRRKGAMAWK